MKSERYIKLGQLTALISFLLGTVIFGLYFLTSAFELLLVGYGFIALIGIINFGVLITILLRGNKDKGNGKRLKRTCGIMLINIPVMLLYCSAAIILLGILRITFTNETGNNLTDINIIGCGGGHIEKLEVGESKTVWINITGDCSIYIDYLSNGQRDGENVAGYVTSSMGQKAKHKIDGKDKEIFL